MQARQIVRHLLRDAEQYHGGPLEFPMEIGNVVTVLIASGYWATPQTLQFAAERGVVDLGRNTHISQDPLTRAQLEALGEYLEENKLWSPLGTQHDHKRDSEDLAATKRLREQLLKMKAAADKIDPIETLDLIVDEANPNYRFILWLSTRHVFGHVLRYLMENTETEEVEV